MSYGLHNLVKPSRNPLSSFDSYPVINNSLSQDKPQILVGKSNLPFTFMGVVVSFCCSVLLVSSPVVIVFIFELKF